MSKPISSWGMTLANTSSINVFRIILGLFRYKDDFSTDKYTKGNYMLSRGRWKWSHHIRFLKKNRTSRHWIYHRFGCDGSFYIDQYTYISYSAKRIPRIKALHPLWWGIVSTLFKCGVGPDFYFHMALGIDLARTAKVRIFSHNSNQTISWRWLVYLV